MISNSGDLVVVTETATGKQVFTGNLLGRNEKIIIGVELPYLKDPASHLASNYEQVKNFKQSDLEDNLDIWLDAQVQYVSFDAKKHTVTVIQENTTGFKAYASNDVYDFNKNKWGETRLGGGYNRAIGVDDNPMKPIENVTIECIGGENIYFIINGLQCAVKCPNINGATFPYAFGIGVYDLVQDPNNPDMLNAKLVMSYDEKLRAELLAKNAA